MFIQFAIKKGEPHKWFSLLFKRGSFYRLDDEPLPLRVPRPLPPP